MTKKSFSSIERLTLVGFAVALSALLMIGVLSILFLRQSTIDDQWVEHTHTVIENLQTCLLAERDMETSARTFVLTGMDSNLDLYKSSFDKLSKTLDTVRRITTDNPSHQRRLSILRPLIDKRLAMAVHVIEARRRSGQQAAIAILFQHDVLVTINEIHHVIDEMQTEERSLLEIRREDHDASSRRLQIIIELGSALAIVFLMAASVLIHRDLRARQRAEEELRNSETRLKKQAEELRAANKELEAFSYSVSHDLRAPLRGIEGFSHLILQNYKDRLDAEGRSYFERIGAAAKRMGVLIDELLELSRITRGPLQIQDVDLSAIARAVEDELQKTDPARQVRWEIPASLIVRGDPSLLHVALTNLLSNAWKFTGKQSHGVIEIGKIMKEGKPIYFVKDNGAGFDMAYKNKLFQAFQRLHSVKEFPGTGIGLATVQRVIRRHGGDIWAQATVDDGATFFFTIS